MCLYIRPLSNVTFKVTESCSHKKGEVLKIGTVIYEPVVVEGFDLSFYYVKRADGFVGEPAKGMVNDITCFADAKTVREKPQWLALSKHGPATRTNKFFNLPWDFVCPINEEYQSYLLDFIRRTSAEKVEGIVLNLYHFPEEGFCTCRRCVKKQKESGLKWTEWRTQAVNDFVRRAKELVSQKFAVEIWPDPLLAKERFGLDFNALAEYVDFFHVPLSAQNYMTIYWADTLTGDFKKLLKKPVYIELSAEILREVETKALLKTMAYVSRHDIDAILLLVHTANRAKQICQTAAKDTGFRDWLDKFGFTKMTKIIEKWEKTC
jgi:hypothetical protein